LTEKTKEMIDEISRFFIGSYDKASKKDWDCCMRFHDDLVEHLRKRYESENECRHLLVPISNEKIDKGFMCINCRKLFDEYDGPKIKLAPWSSEDIIKLTQRQANPTMHEYTCGGNHCSEILIPTKEGWSCPKCDYTQDWCYASDLK